MTSPLITITDVLPLHPKNVKELRKQCTNRDFSAASLVAGVADMGCYPFPLPSEGHTVAERSGLKA